MGKKLEHEGGPFTFIQCTKTHCTFYLWPFMVNCCATHSFPVHKTSWSSKRISQHPFNSPFYHSRWPTHLFISHQFWVLFDNWTTTAPGLQDGPVRSKMHCWILDATWKNAKNTEHAQNAHKKISQIARKQAIAITHARIVVKWVIEEETWGG